MVDSSFQSDTYFFSDFFGTHFTNKLSPSEDINLENDINTSNDNKFGINITPILEELGFSSHSVVENKQEDLAKNPLKHIDVDEAFESNIVTETNCGSSSGISSCSDDQSMSPSLSSSDSNSEKSFFSNDESIIHNEKLSHNPVKNSNSIVNDHGYFGSSEEENSSVTQFKKTNVEEKSSFPNDTLDKKDIIPWETIDVSSLIENDCLLKDSEIISSVIDKYMSPLDDDNNDGELGEINNENIITEITVDDGSSAFINSRNQKEYGSFSVAISDDDDDNEEETEKREKENSAKRHSYGLRSCSKRKRRKTDSSEEEEWLNETKDNNCNPSPCSTPPLYNDNGGDAMGSLLPFTVQDIVTTTDNTDPSSQKSTKMTASGLTIERDFHGRLLLTREERILLSKEGFTLPEMDPLTRENERQLRLIRRKIRNKESARNSRRKKQEYVDNLERRLRQQARENIDLKRRNLDLNRRLDLERYEKKALLEQIRKLKEVVKNPNKHKAMLLMFIMSFSIFFAPSWMSYSSGNYGQEALKYLSDVIEENGDVAGGRLAAESKIGVSRTLLQTKVPDALIAKTKEGGGLDPYGVSSQRRDEGASEFLFEDNIMQSPLSVGSDTSSGENLLPDNLITDEIDETTTHIENDALMKEKQQQTYNILQDGGDENARSQKQKSSESSLPVISEEEIPISSDWMNRSSRDEDEILESRETNTSDARVHVITTTSHHSNNHNNDNDMMYHNEHNYSVAGNESRNKERLIVRQAPQQGNGGSNRVKNNQTATTVRVVTLPKRHSEYRLGKKMNGNYEL